MSQHFYRVASQLCHWDWFRPSEIKVSILLCLRSKGRKIMDSTVRSAFKSLWLIYFLPLRDPAERKPEQKSLLDEEGWWRAEEKLDWKRGGGLDVCIWWWPSDWVRTGNYFFDWLFFTVSCRNTEVGKPGLCGQEGSVRTIRTAEVSRYFLHRLEAAAQTECGWAGTLLEIWAWVQTPEHGEHSRHEHLSFVAHDEREFESKVLDDDLSLCRADCI